MLKYIAMVEPENVRAVATAAGYSVPADQQTRNARDPARNPACNPGPRTEDEELTPPPRSSDGGKYEQQHNAKSDSASVLS